MLFNYLKTSWRSLTKNKAFSFINIVGLATGMAACLFILQYVSFELSYDHFNKNVPNIYRLVNDHYQDGKRVQHSTMTYSGMSRAIKEEYPEVENYSRVEPYRVEVISYGNKKIGDQRAIAVDNSFLTFFSYPLLEGDVQTALKETNSVVVSEKLAGKLVTDNISIGSLVGQTIIFDRDSVPYKITGICKDAPSNSHLQFNLLMSYVSLYSIAGNNRWGRADYDFIQSNFWHYILLKEGVDHKQLEAKLPALSNKLFPKNKAAGKEDRFYLQPLAKAHLYSDYEYEIASNSGNIKTVVSLLVIALFILVIAWANYINLTTAKSIERAKEVGIRKVIGASRGQLIRQFLTEAILVNGVALAIALLLVSALQGNFNQLVQKEVSLSDLFVNGYAGNILVISLIGVMIGGILLSGFYPAFVLSAYKPIKVLKGRFVSSSKGILLRKGLVIGQFAITIILIIGSFIVYRQVKFMNSQPLGYDLEQMLVLRKPVLTSRDSIPFANKAKNFIAELDRIANVQGAAVSGRIPGDELGKERNVYRMDAPSANQITVNNMGVDDRFIDLYKLRLLSGRNFSSSDYNADRSKLTSVIINETAQEMLGFASSEEAIGKSIMLFKRKWDIIGVINDFHHKSLRYAMEPTVLIPSLQGVYSSFSVKVATEYLPSTIDKIQKAYASFFPGNLFDYYFLDEKFNRQYADDRLFGQVFGLFAGLAIVIACLGLFGLSLLAASQRRKEIGVRKVLGASVASIVLILSKDFIKLVGVAFVIASPIAWYVMNSWLDDFAYRVNITIWVFIGAGLLALIIAVATISFQAIKAAIVNPGESLRAE